MIKFTIYPGETDEKFSKSNHSYYEFIKLLRPTSTQSIHRFDTVNTVGNENVMEFRGISTIRLKVRTSISHVAKVFVFTFEWTWPKFVVSFRQNWQPINNSQRLGSLLFIPVRTHSALVDSRTCGFQCLNWIRRYNNELRSFMDHIFLFVLFAWRCVRTKSVLGFERINSVVLLLSSLVGVCFFPLFTKPISLCAAGARCV